MSYNPEIYKLMHVQVFKLCIILQIQDAINI